MEDDCQEHARLFSVFANATRLRILNILLKKQGTIAVEDLAQQAGVKQPTVSHHLDTLKKAHIIELTTRSGCTTITQ